MEGTDSRASKVQKLQRYRTGRKFYAPSRKICTSDVPLFFGKGRYSLDYFSKKKGDVRYMKTTVTIHANKGEISYAHNYRDEQICRHEPHIDPDGVHEIWVQKSMNEVYDECFKDALEEYNAKQKRKDRRMTMEQYIESVKNDKRGRKQTKRVNGKRVIDENARQKWECYV